MTEILLGEQVDWLNDGGEPCTLYTIQRPDFQDKALVNRFGPGDRISRTEVGPGIHYYWCDERGTTLLATLVVTDPDAPTTPPTTLTASELVLPTSPSLTAPPGG